ncbi:MAG: glutathione S-transferase [Rhodospirillaceae bacterium]|nr:glutathione S-transferase [Rhodospirillaceae bacterium]|tara:strand:+ start:45899 stop:46531 length:633 start_codon:yes stop_codon:yes gene_type:complete
MIDLYTTSTPNGRKVSILLEECGFEYTTHVINIRDGDQHDPAYRAINPNEKIPAIIDQDGPGGKPIRVFETAAIMQYLAGKSGRFMGNDEITRTECQQWLSLVTTGLAPTFVQVFYWTEFAPNATTEEVTAFGKQRYRNEMQRLIGVLDFRLREYEYLAKTYTIADMAAYPWIDRHEFFEFSLDDFVGVRNWYNRLSKRAAIQRGIKVPS